MLRLAVFSIAFICSFQAVFGQDLVNSTTSRPDPYEHEAFSFIYEGSTHQMLMITDGKCYIWMLSADERAHVHTDAGIRTVELRLLKQVNHAYFTKIPPVVLNTAIVSQCRAKTGHNRHVEFYLVH